jgi:hypothetical protein
MIIIGMNIWIIKKICWKMHINIEKKEKNWENKILKENLMTQKL